MLTLAVLSTVIFAAAWGLARAMPRATAATRHLIWHGAVIASLGAPLAAPFVPPLPHAPGATTLAAAIAQVRSPSAATTPVLDRSSSLADLASDAAPLPEAQPSAVVAALAQTIVAAEAGGTTWRVAVVGTAVCTLWFVLGWAFTAIAVRRAAPAPIQWQVELNALREKLRIPGDVRLRVAANGSSPLAAGIRRPTILLPARAADWCAERRRAVLVHELAHIRRADCRGQLLAQAACALYWFNPIVWIAAARLRAERERACDDEVLRQGTRASDYAADLLAIARELRPILHPTAALAMARPRELEGRLLAVLEDRGRTPWRATRWAVCGLLAVASGVAVSAATLLRPAPVEVTTPTRDSNVSLTFDVLTSDERAATARRNAEAAATLQTSPDVLARRRAAADLSQEAPAQAASALEAALTDPDPDVREKAALGLAFQSGRDVIPALLRALVDVDPQVREKAAIGLALRRDSRIVAPLLVAIGDPDAQVREKVAIALGTSGDPQVRDALVRALRDPDGQVREKAAAALILLGFAQ